MRILLAVSGGIDSMYLASRAPELFPGASLAVAHCNFRLRGTESDGDENFVREWCGEHGIPLLIKQFETATYASEHGISIEMAARELRYAWFAELCSAEGFDALAVAHNANDNAETLMLNLLRGTGSKGMRGIAARSTMKVPGCENALTILRPMLKITRDEIRAWMQANGQLWREDRTNAENDCKRNVIRNRVFPILKEINPSFIQTLGADMARFAQADDIAEDYLASAGLDPESIEVDRLLALKHWEFVLWRLLEPYSFSQPTFGKLVALLRRFREEPRGTVTLGGKTFQSPTHTLKARRGRLVISKKTQTSTIE